MTSPLMPPPGGFVLWEGPGRLDGKPIVAIATIRSENRKTGPMIQTWIIRADRDPLDAIQSGADASVCGSCPLRGIGGKGRACYVNPLKGGPHMVYRSYRAGQYPAFSDRWSRLYFSGRFVRLGSYGDPVAVPLGVWTGVLAWCGGHTGYTHQWRRMDSLDYAAIVMASVETESERLEAKSLGFRTYRILPDGVRPGKGESLCPASPAGGSKLTCAECLACDGSARGRRRQDIAIPLHGSLSVISAGRRVIGGK